MRRFFLFLVPVFLIAANPAFGAEKGGAVMSKEEIKKKLTPLQYEVTQQCGTEKPFDNAYWNDKRAGIYVDIVSGEPLFSSLDKFDSGTGWPSFTKPIDEANVVQDVDTSGGRTRQEVKSAKGGSHLGHVFDDGPRPTGKRYCINSASLRFIPAEDLEKEGYGRYAYLFDKTKSAAYKRATFGGGCFWGVEALFKELPGVVETTAGYSGGKGASPTYEDVKTGTTGHAEAVEILYDPSKVSYEDLLDYFFRLHDPTTLNRQGPDVGTQYRSVIFYHDEAQKKAALAFKKKFDKENVLGKPSVTEIVPAGAFYRAEEYHQDYFQKQGGAVCHHLRAK